jgi:hypothetical protein
MIVTRECSLEETEEKMYCSVEEAWAQETLDCLLRAHTECVRLGSLSPKQQSEMTNRIQYVQHIIDTTDYQSLEEYCINVRNYITLSRITEDMEAANERTLQLLAHTEPEREEEKKMSQEHQDLMPQLMVTNNRIPEPPSNSQKEDNPHDSFNPNSPTTKLPPNLECSQSTRRSDNEPNTKPPKAQELRTLSTPECSPSTRLSENENGHNPTSIKPKTPKLSGISIPKQAILATELPHQVYPTRKPNIPNPVQSPDTNPTPNTSNGTSNPVGHMPKHLVTSNQAQTGIQLPPTDHGTPKPPPAPNLNPPEPLANSNSIPGPRFKASHKKLKANPINNRNTGKENTNKSGSKKPHNHITEDTHRANQRIQEEWNGQRCKPVITV